MFKYEQVKDLNDLELEVYNYIMRHQEKVLEMKIRELAEGSHVSTTTVLRFCKKMGCNGYSEFKVKYKMYLNEVPNQAKKEDIRVLVNFFYRADSEEFNKQLDEVASLIYYASKVIFLGIVEGITEWLPISSTGHMIILDEFVKLNVREEFWNLFLVVIQLGAILAVVLLFWNQIFPLNLKDKKEPVWKKDILLLWVKILVACVPAGIVGVLFDDVFDKYLYNFPCVAMALIVFGILFIIVEKKKKGTTFRITSIDQLDYKTVVWIGVFQLIAAVFPGTSRSGATIIGALLLGVSRVVAAEFTFYLAIPVMFGASLLKLVKFLMMGLSFTSMELAILAVGCIVSFVVSIIVIKFLMGYIKKHDFIPFGIYRIVLGAVLLIYFALVC